jgi:hypothetical protein
MSAANSASQPARRGVAMSPTTRPAPLTQRPVGAASQPPKVGFAPAQSGNELKLNLADIPRAQETLDVEGFKPSLLSRLFDLLAPLKSR